MSQTILLQKGNVAVRELNRDYFPEHFFTPLPAHHNSYWADTARGYARMSSRRVVIGGLARDLGGLIETTMARVERLGRLFGDYRVVIYENDSQDNTRTRLNEWAEQNQRVLVVSERLNNPVNRSDRSLARAERMAYYRRQCHRKIVQRFGDFDNVILVDTDMEGGWSYDGIANTFGKDNWDFVGSNGVIYRRHGLDLNRLVHFDAWAFRQDDAFTPMTTAEVNAFTFSRGEPLVPLSSCFGGLGIYDMKAFAAGEYDNGTDIEHVPFHRSMRENGFGRMFLNPSQVTLYGRRHRTYDAIANRIRRLRDQLLGNPETECYFEKGKTTLAEQLCEVRRAA